MIDRRTSTASVTAVLYGARGRGADPGRSFVGLAAEFGRIGGMEPVLKVAHPRDWAAGWLHANRAGRGGDRMSNVVGLRWPPHGRQLRLLAPVLTGGAADATARDAALAEGGTAVAALRAA